MNFRKLKNIFSKQRSSNYETTNYSAYAQFYEDENINNGKFKENLIKTINWTTQIIGNIKDKDKIDYLRILRTTNPIYEGHPFYRFEKTYHGYAATPEIPFNYTIVLNEVLKLRTNLEFSKDDLEKNGRVLKFEIDVTTQDGAPCTETEGFIDESDIPPIDTWFYITKKNLYCWIPNIFIETIQHAMEVEILGSYNWVDFDIENT
jgi:hypothetical protein